MQNIEGGGVLGCAGVVASAIGIAALFTVAAPVSIAGTAWLMTQGIAAGFGMGVSIADCANL